MKKCIFKALGLAVAVIAGNLLLAPLINGGNVYDPIIQAPAIFWCLLFGFIAGFEEAKSQEEEKKQEE